MTTETPAMADTDGRTGGLARARRRTRRIVSAITRDRVAPGTLPQDASEASIRVYARRLHQALAVFRFFFFAMGVGLSFMSEASRLQAIPLGLLIGLVGLYNVGRVWWPPDPSRRSPVIESVFLMVDVALAAGVVLATGGLDSPFLIYSLAPALTAGFFLGVASASLAAVVSALLIIGAHEISRVGLGSYPHLISSNLLAFALLYGSVSVLVAGLPFLANLNWQRRQRNLAADSERQRLRREVHDDVAQTLAFLSLKLQLAEGTTPGRSATLTGEDVRGIREVVRRSYVAVRDYLDGTADAAFVEPLKVGISAVVSQWSSDTGVRSTIQVSGTEPALAPSAKRQVLQIVREALANVAKHANARHVAVRMVSDASQAEITIRDDGRGFEPGASGGHGLEIMRQRASIVDATLSITSEPELGTEVKIVCRPK